MKEIKSFNRIVEATKNKEMLIIIVDEILRGTNTKERLAASAAILDYLQTQNCLVIVASHDFELLQLLNSDNFDNFYFCEQTKEEKIIFDFKIHKGISEQTNAIKLLKHVGFPESIIKNAKAIYSKIDQKTQDKTKLR